MVYIFSACERASKNIDVVHFPSSLIKVINFNLRKTSFALESASAPGRDDGDSSEINVV